MALTHHLIVQVAAIRSKAVSGSTLAPYFDKYALLGDDLVIKHDHVAAEYKNLTKVLDMPFSVVKTHTSSEVFEFAKRWFYRGTEVSGFSISGLLSVWKSYPLLLNYLATQNDHGWILPFDRHPDLILALHKVMYGDSFIYEKTQRMISLYMVFSQVSILKNRNKTGYPELIKLIKLYFGFDLLAYFSNLEKPCDIIELMYIEAKRYLVEKDLYSFQTEAYKVNAKLNKFVKDRIKEARVDQTTAEFLMETCTTVLNWNHPLVLVLNNLIDLSTEFLMNYWDPDISLDFLISSGLSKYKFTKGTFSMRKSASIILADSAILKSFLTVIKDYDSGVFNIVEHPSGNLVLERKTQIK